MLEEEKDFIEEERIIVDTAMAKCSGCGANMVFNPDKNLLSCPHCGSTKTISNTGLASEQVLENAFSKDQKWNDDEAVAFRCDNCGAEVVMSNGESATACPFCGTSHVQKKEELDGLKPNALLPFSFGIDRAIEYSKAWAKRAWYAPRKFKKNLSADNVHGVYTPCFTFDSYTTSHYVGRIGDRRTRVVGSGKNRRTQTYVVWRNISGTYYSSFDDLLISAGSKFNQGELNKITPYQTSSSINYTENYLLGYMAYHYDREITDCWQDAKNCIDNALKNSILSQYHYDVVDYLNVSTTHDRVTYKYVMLPIYLGNFKFNKKVFNFYVNGTTGKVGGKRPKSALRIGGLALGILAVVGLIVLLAVKCSNG